MIIHIVMQRSEFEEWECEVAFRTAKEAQAYIRREMKSCNVPKKEWDEFFLVQEVVLK